MFGMDFYHALNRGVDGRIIFTESGDYIRFVRSMYLFNDERPANNTTYILKNNKEFERHPIVEIHGWCLMKNHYHLLLTEKQENGISSFLRKLNVGYARYYSDKYKHRGHLFQGRTKKIPIVKDGHFNHILHYIHLNPLDYMRGSDTWRERKLANARSAEEYLAKYRWSSLPDYLGTKNFPSIVDTSFFDDPRGSYKKTFREYLSEIEIETIKGLTLD